MPPHPPTLSRRTLLAGIAALPLAGWAATHTTPTASHATPAGANKPITIGYVPIACAAPLILADAHNTFAHHGLQVQLRKFAGWSELWSAYVTQDIDVAHMLSPMPLAINHDQQRGRSTTIAATLNTNGQALVLASALTETVHSARDLKGLTLAIPFEYSVHSLLLRDLVDSAGLDPDTDLNLQLLRPADMVAQLATGTIDGFIGPEPLSERALAQGFGRVFTLTKDCWDNHPCCCIAFSPTAGTLPATIAGQLRGALHDAVHTLPRADTPTILAQENYLNQPEKFVAGALSGTYQRWDSTTVTDPERMRFDAPTDRAAVTWMAAQLARWDLGIPRTTTAITAAADSVLEAQVHGSTTLKINNRTFDPTQPLREAP